MNRWSRWTRWTRWTQCFCLCLLATACGDDAPATSGGASETTTAASTTTASTTATAASTLDGSSTVAATDSADSGDSTTGPAATHERLWLATGEYLATQDWHAILRFEDALLLDAWSQGPAAADGTTNVQASTDASGVPLNFVHSIMVDEARDELYAATLFTTTDPNPCPMASLCGSIAVFAGAASLDGPAVTARHIFGPATTLEQPHGVWLDRQRDILYVANTFAGTLLAWHDAPTVDGDVGPDRTITSPTLGAPVYVYVDETDDRAFVGCMPPFGEPGGPPPPPTPPHIEIFEQLSTLDGMVEPSFRIEGPSTRLSIGNPTTHNTWYIPAAALLVVAHHTNEVLFFDLADLPWGEGGPPMQLDLAPRVLEINETGTDAGEWSAYGLSYVPEADRLYVSAGYTPGGPAANSEQHAIKVYEGVSDPGFAGRVTPVREIRWDSYAQYFPPQPLWVQRW